MPNKHISILEQLPPPIANKHGWPWEASKCGTVPSSNHYPRISIVTPSFNQAYYLEETIRSVLLQNYPNLQYIIIDGASTDGSVEIIKKYDKWLDFWISEPDKGQSHAINKGLSKADGVWFNWINSDDCLLPNALLNLASHSISNTTQVISGLLDFGTNLENIRKTSKAFIASNVEQTIVFHNICQPAMFFRLSTVLSFQGLNESLHYTMDLDLWIRILSRYGVSAVSNVDFPMAFFREHAEAKTSRDARLFFEDEYLIFRHLSEACGLPTECLHYISSSCIILPNFDIGSVDRALLSELIVRRYLWSKVESFWSNRNYSAFKQLIALYFCNFRRYLTARGYMLFLLSKLPTGVLRLISSIRKNHKDGP